MACLMRTLIIPAYRLSSDASPRRHSETDPQLFIWRIDYANECR